MNKQSSVLTITSPENDETVFLCSEAARRYLLAEDASVSDFCPAEGYQGVKITWNTQTIDDIRAFRLEWTQSDRNAGTMTKEIDPSLRETTLDNLCKAAVYNIKLTAKRTFHPDAAAEITFRTAETGPRPLTVDGIHNVRDLGGWRTRDGRRIRQGLLFRGGSLTSVPDYPQAALTSAGAEYLHHTLRIRFDMDLRSRQESGTDVSPIPGAAIAWFHIDGYASAFSESYRKKYLAVFQAFSKKENYPIYLHCTGGADRTGTVSFLLLALLGVERRDLIHDYEYTSFSIYGERNTKSGVYSSYFQSFLHAFEAQSGNTDAEKAESYLRYLGLSARETEDIRTILIENR